MVLNKDLIRARFADIEQSLGRLNRLKSLSRDEFLDDQDSKDLASYRLQIAIEAALQICFHIAAQHLHHVPEAYAECFAILAENDLLDPDLAANLQRMAGFRNMLVHVYWQVDYDQVYDMLQSHLGDLQAFMAAVGELQ